MYADVIPLLRLPRPARAFTYAIPDAMLAEARPGALVQIPWRGRPADAVIHSISQTTDIRRVSPLTKVHAGGRMFLSQAHLNALIKHAHEQAISWPTLAHALMPSVPRRLRTDAALPPAIKPARAGLTPWQTLPKSILPSLQTASNLKDKERGIHIHRLADRLYLYRSWCLATPKQVLILVPQLIDGEELQAFLQTTLGEGVALWGAPLNAQAAWSLYLDIQKGAYRIIVSTRSGALLPLASLGLVIIDQEERIEHRSWESHPYYDARDIARLLAKEVAVPYRETSLCPRVERKMIFPYATTPNIDAPITTFYHTQRQPILHNDLQKLLHTCLDQGKNAIIVATKKASHATLLCADCQHRWMCPQCQSSLQSFSQGLTCPNCDYQEILPQACPKCSGARLRAYGAGLDALQQELPNLGFLNLQRFDAKQQSAFVLDRRQPCLMLSTPYTWKRLAYAQDFPVGALLLFHPETILYAPDYRANEWYRHLIQWHRHMTYSLFRLPLTIQTNLTDSNPLHSMAVSGTDDDLLRVEHATRESRQYPPFGHSFLLRLRHGNPDEIKNVQEHLLALAPFGTIRGPKQLARTGETQWLIQSGQDPSVILDKFDDSVYSKILIYRDPESSFFV